jgi:isopentenyl-diphosphate delta-isomerase type 1
MREVIDIVNENDEVIGKGDREEVHGKFPHRTVHIFVINSKGELYIQKRSLKKKNFPSYWDSSSSEHVISGETYEEAAKRGLKEELGIDASNLKFILELSPSELNHKEFIRLYVCRYDNEMKLDRNEISEGKFIGMNRLSNEIKQGKNFTPVFSMLFEVFRQKSNTLNLL